MTKSTEQASPLEKQQRQGYLGTDDNKNFEWTQVLETLRLMRDTIISSKEMGWCLRARLYHDFIIILLCTTVSPSRNADLMKLKILFDEE